LTFALIEEWPVTALLLATSCQLAVHRGDRAPLDLNKSAANFRLAAAMKYQTLRVPLKD
jgi:hypothetical protein